MNSLPDKPSQLIRLAIADLEKCEQHPNYEIDMEKWWLQGKKKCYVCLAGAVMAQTLPDSYLHSDPCIVPANYPSSISSKLHALNYFRMGLTVLGMSQLGIDYKGYDMYVPDYKDNPELFKEIMLLMAEKFEVMGQ